MGKTTFFCTSGNFAGAYDLSSYRIVLISAITLSFVFPAACTSSANLRRWIVSRDYTENAGPIQPAASKIWSKSGKG
jgi:hypothetical protein